MLRERTQPGKGAMRATYCKLAVAEVGERELLEATTTTMDAKGDQGRKAFSSFVSA